MSLDPLNFLWAGALVVYVSQPLEYYDFLREWYGEDLIAAGIALSGAALAMVVVGYECSVGRRVANALPKTPFRLAPKRFRAISLLLVGLGSTGYAYQVASAGGVGAWLSVSRGGTDWELVSAWLAQLSDLVPIGVVLFLLHTEIHREGIAQRVLAWAGWGTVVLWLFYLGSRSRLILAVAAGIAAYSLPRRRNPPVALLGAVFFVVVAATSIQTYYRGRFTNLRIDLQDVATEELQGMALPSALGGDAGMRGSKAGLGMEFSCVLAVLSLVPETVPYNYGYGYLQFFTNPIPRAIWPDKRYPLMESLQGVFSLGGLTNTYVRDTGLLMGPAFTLVGHWYYAGGVVGVFLGSLLAGILCRTIREVLERAPGSEGDILVFSQFMYIGFSEAAATPLAFVFALPSIVLGLGLVFALSRVRGDRGPAFPIRRAQMRSQTKAVERPETIGQV